MIALLGVLRTTLAILHTACCSIVGILAMSTGLRDGDWVMWKIGRQRWSEPLLRWIVRTDIEVQLPQEIQNWAAQGRGAVLVANHTSLLDINAAFAACPAPIVFLSKASIRKVPLLGKINEMAGTVFVERGNRNSSDKAVRELTETLNKGRNVLVFPEGTRSPNGKLQSFKKGAFHLAKAANAPIVPLHIAGTWEILPSDAWILKKARRPVIVQFGTPIESKDKNIGDLMAEAQAQIEQLASLH